MGWTAGGGFEAEIVSGLSAKLEYLYVDCGTFNCGVIAPVLWSIRLNSTRICFGSGWIIGSDPVMNGLSSAVVESAPRGLSVSTVCH